MYAVPWFLQTVLDILPDNDLVPPTQLGDEQHISTGEKRKEIMEFGYQWHFRYH